MMKKQVMTPEAFERIPWKQLLIRGLVKDEGDGLLRRVTTTLHLFTAESDENTNQVFAHLIYKDECQPGGAKNSYARSIGLDLECLPADPLKRAVRIQGILEEWSRGGARAKPAAWFSTDPVVVCVWTGRDDLIVPETSIPLLQHYARLETRIVYEIQVHDPTRARLDGWILGNFFYRVSALLKRHNDQWQRMMGGPEMT